MHISDLVKTDESHCAQAAALLREAFPHAYGDCAEEEVNTCLSEGRIALVSLEGGRVLGFVGAIPQYENTGWELHPLVVDKACRNRGIGRALMAALEARLRKKGCLTVYLGTDDEYGRTSLSDIDLFENTYEKIERVRNLHNHPYEFYQKCGYKIVGVIPDANGLGQAGYLYGKKPRAGHMSRFLTEIGRERNGPFV